MASYSCKTKKSNKFELSAWDAIPLAGALAVGVGVGQKDNMSLGIGVVILAGFYGMKLLMS